MCRLQLVSTWREQAVRIKPIETLNQYCHVITDKGWQKREKKKTIEEDS